MGAKSDRKSINSEQKTKKVEKSKKFRLTHLNICATNRLWRSKNTNLDIKWSKFPESRPTPCN